MHESLKSVPVLCHMFNSINNVYFHLELDLKKLHVDDDIKNKTHDILQNVSIVNLLAHFLFQIFIELVFI